MVGFGGGLPLAVIRASSSEDASTSPAMGVQRMKASGGPGPRSSDARSTAQPASRRDERDHPRAAPARTTMEGGEAVLVTARPVFGKNGGTRGREVENLHTHAASVIGHSLMFCDEFVVGK